MFSKKINFRGITFRLIVATCLLLFLSLIFVSTLIYVLLARTLRESDQHLILGLAQSYRSALIEGGPASLRGKIPPDLLVMVTDKKGKVLFEHLPAYIDHDFEDEDEIAQIRQEGEMLPLKEGWTSILLLSGEEDKNFIEEFEYELWRFGREQDWTTLIPIIDNDIVEVFVTPVDEYWMKIGRSSEEREEHLVSIRYIAFAVIIPFLFVGVLLSILLAGSVLKPVKNLLETIRRLRAGEGKSRARSHGSGDEIDRLADEFNQLLDMNEELLNNLKETLDNVAHEIRTPLTRLRSGAEVALLRDTEKSEFREALQEALENSDKLLRLLNALMDVTEARSHLMPMKKVELSLGAVLRDAVELYEFVAESKGMKIELDEEKEFIVSADETRLLQALSNLLDNAIKYSHGGTTVTIKTSSLGHEAVQISFIDQGPGVAPEDRERIWDRLYRGDKSRSTPGLGIGLSLVKAIVERHGGTTRVESHSQGSEFIVTLPLCNPAERKA